MEFCPLRQAVKFYITNTLKKPNRVPIRQFFVRVEQLNCYLESLPGLFNSPKANSATKPVMPLEDADFGTHLLRMCPVKWQRQYDLMENSTPVSTRALLMVLENIESNVELDEKPPARTRQKELTTSVRWLPLKHVSPRKPRRAGKKSTIPSARNMGARTPCTTPRSAGAITVTGPRRRQQQASLSLTSQHTIRLA
jgi:hypothetical protein